MNCHTILTLTVLLTAAVFVNAAEIDFSRIDSLNVNEILANDRLFNNFFKCLLDQGRCTNDGKSLKGIIPEIVRTRCEKCPDTTKEKIKMAINTLMAKKAPQWKQLSAKYTPNDEWKYFV